MPEESVGWPAANWKEPLMVLVLLLVIAAIALGIIGAVIKGLLYLLIIGIAVFLVAFIVLGTRLGRRRPAR